MTVEPEDLFEIVSRLRQAGVRETRIATFVRLTHSAYRSVLHHHRRVSGWRLPKPCSMPAERLEEAVAALLVAMRTGTRLTAADALVLACTGPTVDAMLDSAHTLTFHRWAEAADLEWFGQRTMDNLSLAA